MKKSILILTDLSENARHAAEAASLLAGKLHSNLIILTCDETISAVTYYPVVPVMVDFSAWHEDTSAKAAILADDLKHQFTDAFPGHPLPVIKTLIRQGDLRANVTDIVKEYPIEMIVMGASSGSPTDHFLFGSETKSVVDHSPVPIFIVPARAINRATLKITFGTNFLPQDTYALHYLERVRKQTGAQLEIVHIRQYGQISVEKNPVVRLYIEKICADNSPMIAFNEVYGKDVVSRLSHYCKGNDSDILALSHEHHSVLFRMFQKGTVEKSLHAQPVPMLIIPDLKAGSQSGNESLKGLSGIVF